MNGQAASTSFWRTTVYHRLASRMPTLFPVPADTAEAGRFAAALGVSERVITVHGSGSLGESQRGQSDAVGRDCLSCGRSLSYRFALDIDRVHAAACHELVGLADMVRAASPQCRMIAAG
jgi:hypothetical protein